MAKKIIKKNLICRTTFFFSLFFFLFSAVLFSNDLGIDQLAIDTLKKLEIAMNSVSSVQSDYIETKKLALFTDAIVITGTMGLQKNGFFAWHVEKPVKYAMIMKGNTITEWDEDTNRVITKSIGGSPFLSVISEKMKEWFSGKYISMMNEYKITIIQANPLIIKFIPFENNPASKMIKTVILEFSEKENYVKRITIEEQSSDSTEIEFLNTKLDEPIDDQMWEACHHGG